MLLAVEQKKNSLNPKKKKQQQHKFFSNLGINQKSLIHLNFDSFLFGINK